MMEQTRYLQDRSESEEQCGQQSISTAQARTHTTRHTCSLAMHSMRSILVSLDCHDVFIILTDPYSFSHR